LQGNPGTGETFEGAPNIDHSQEHVQQDISGWLRWLKDDVSFSGFRFDYAKGWAAFCALSAL
jgi:alpha-amylase